MARLPQPGADSGSWGQILNDFLSQTHNADGSLKNGAVSESQLDTAVQTKLNNVGSGTVSDGAITTQKLADDAVTSAKIAAGTIVNTDINATAAIDQTKVANLVTDLSAKVDKSTAPIRFAAAVAITGVTPTDRAYVARTLTGARMRVASAPNGSALTAQVQHYNGTSWTTIGTATIASGSVVESVISFSQSQALGDLLRLNVTSIGSSTAATGVVVDVLWT